MPLDTNPFSSWATVLDCGDIPVTSYVNPPPERPGRAVVPSSAPNPPANLPIMVSADHTQQPR